MNRTYKIWICGSVAANGQLQNVKDLVETFYWFDGAIFTINRTSNDDLDEYRDTYNLLETHRKDGRILECSWVKLHYIPMSMCLQTEDIKNGDWVLFVDAQELPKQEWLEEMRSNVAKYKTEGITTVMWGRPYFFEYNDQMLFEGQPHCWVRPFTPGKTISITDEDKVRYDEGGVHFGDFIYNRKNLDDTTLLHACKYMLCYNISNESINQFGEQGREVVIREEIARRELRDYLRNDLGLDMRDFDDLIRFFRKGKYDDTFIRAVEKSLHLKIVYRYYILKTPRQVILDTPCWSFSGHLNPHIPFPL